MHPTSVVGVGTFAGTGVADDTFASEAIVIPRALFVDRSASGQHSQMYRGVRL